MKSAYQQPTNSPTAELRLKQTDSPGLLQLFALALTEAHNVWREGDRLIPQGTLWQGWCALDLRLEDLLDLNRLPQPPAYWPAQVREAHRLIRESPAFDAALKCVQRNHQVFGVNEVSELARILAAVAQTLRPADKAGKEYQDFNRWLAQQAYSFARRRLDEALQSQAFTSQTPPLPGGAPANWPVATAQQEPGSFPKPPVFDLRPYQDRPDELGAKITTTGLTLWHASHRGPAHAGKLKNQDATFALAVGDSLVFAVADGVSTSMGSRMAAAIVARSFCEYLADHSDWRSPENSLYAAAATAQKRLDQLLDAVEASNTEAFHDLYDGLQTSAVKRILENTRTRKSRNLPLAFATTLLGGFVFPAGGGRYQVHFLCIGDGLVEHRDHQGSKTSILGMDNQETAISATICPGPFGRESLRQPILRPLLLESGDWLLISSDGLTRGHQQLAWLQLEDIQAAQWFNSGSEQLAWQVLNHACQVADARFEEPRLFGDNLSLILLAAQ